jgi:nucleotide-binding universal stress UspA family protein
MLRSGLRMLVGRGGDGMARYLVVANQTLGGDQLVHRLEELGSAGPCVLRVLVPVTQTEGFHQWDYPPIDRAIPDASVIARTLAEGRLEHELTRLRRAGVEASGEVVDADPVEKVRQELATSDYDGVVMATLPRRLSRWLVMDLPHRIARASQVPVIQVESSAGPSL